MSGNFFRESSLHEPSARSRLAPLGFGGSATSTFPERGQAMRTRTRCLGASFAVALLLALPLAIFAGSFQLGAKLTPTEQEPDAFGAVLYERRFVGHDPVRRLQVAVEGVASTDVVAVLFNWVFIDYIALEDGAGYLDWSTGHGYDPPELQEADVILIVDAYDGERVLLEGTLGVIH